MNQRTYCIVIGDLPEAADRRELLELVLAAASLDLSVQVRLLGRARELLTGGADADWAQLVDHGLAEVIVDQAQSIDAAEPTCRTARSASALPGDAVVIRT